MRAKRSKQYRKLMQQYQITFGFREPYQVLVDAEMMQDAERFKMDLLPALERTLHGKVKPMITQCSIRHLYSAEPKDDRLIEKAKTLERRRCNHHLLDQPLDTLECFSSVVDPKEQNVNKHKLVIATQDQEVRQKMRSIPGVPLIYIKKSIMILEPMAGATEDVRSREERGKLKSGIIKRGTRSLLGKRTRDEAEGKENAAAEGGAQANGEAEEPVAAPKKKVKGPKGANPLSMKKPKVRGVAQPYKSREERGITIEEDEAHKKKRKRKHKAKAGGEGDVAAEGDSD